MLTMEYDKGRTIKFFVAIIFTFEIFVLKFSCTKPDSVQNILHFEVVENKHFACFDFVHSVVHKIVAKNFLKLYTVLLFSTYRVIQYI